MTKYRLNSFRRELDRTIGISTSAENLRSMLESDFSERVNPVQAYFHKLPPATGTQAIDELTATVTDGALRLQQAEGSLWQGRGILASRDAGGRSLTPWLPLAWRFDGGALARFAMGWDFSTSGSPLAHVELGPAGLKLGGLKLHAPAGAALAAIPHPAASAGWHGDLSIAAPRWDCPADGRCSGEASLLWRGAGSALFPGRSFGDYQLQVGAEAGSLRFTLATLAGPIMASGCGMCMASVREMAEISSTSAPGLLRVTLWLAPGAGPGRAAEIETAAVQRLVGFLGVAR